MPPAIQALQFRRSTGRSRRVPPALGHHKSARFKPLPSRANLTQDIAIFEIALGEFEHGRVPDRADLQPSDIGAAERRCRAAVPAPNEPRPCPVSKINPREILVAVPDGVDRQLELAVLDFELGGERLAVLLARRQALFERHGIVNLADSGRLFAAPLL